MDSILIVSEDPFFVEEMREKLGTGVRVIACLGPAATPCFLDEKGSCPLASHSGMAIVDAPPGGSFRHHWWSLEAGEYAERLKRAHPELFVLLCTNGEGSSGPTGEVVVAEGRNTTLSLLGWLLPTSSFHLSHEPSTSGVRR